MTFVILGAVIGICCAVCRCRLSLLLALSAFLVTVIALSAVANIAVQLNHPKPNLGP